MKYKLHTGVQHGNTKSKSYKHQNIRIMGWGMRYASPFPSPLITLPLTISKARGWSIHNFLHVTSHNQRDVTRIYRPTWRHPLNPGKEILEVDKLFNDFHPECFNRREKCRHFLPYDFASKNVETPKVNDTWELLTHEYWPLVWNSIQTRKRTLFKVM
jgi:hypothetical protein